MTGFIGKLDWPYQLFPLVGKYFFLFSFEFQIKVVTLRTETKKKLF